MVAKIDHHGELLRPVMAEKIPGGEDISQVPMYSLTEMGRAFGLSRSTLHHYDRIGLLSPSARTRSKYRLYSQMDCEKLKIICRCRRIGLSLKEIHHLLSSEGEGSTEALRSRLCRLNGEVLRPQIRQRFLIYLLHLRGMIWQSTTMDRDIWAEKIQPLQVMRKGNPDRGVICKAAQ
jgi:DNA-binding transcriptional MerR regulator